VRESSARRCEHSANLDFSRSLLARAALILKAMELFLNLAWLTVVIAIGAVSVRCWPARNRRARWLSLGALLCAGVLLLPVISVTDDLHPQAFVVEDSNSTKRLASGITHDNPVVPAVWLAMVLAALGCVAVRSVSWRFADQFSEPYRSPLFNRLILGRAPPTSLAV
jgi:hypothetical protein